MMRQTTKYQKMCLFGIHVAKKKVQNSYCPNTQLDICSVMAPVGDCMGPVLAL
jgi:hypothetical protein